MLSRDILLQRLRKQAKRSLPLIIGGGINGIGVYRDLALQKIPCLLVDKGDFCGATSAASSRLIHGGLRYLETAEFRLVRESVLERDALLRNAPHQILPLPVWAPTFSWTAGLAMAVPRALRLARDPGPKGALLIKLGLSFFDAFGGPDRRLPRHRLISAQTARRRLPALPAKLAAVLEYYDTRLRSPERLAMELIADAERDCPASLAIPYLEVTGAKGGAVQLSDRLSGETFIVTPALAVNCAGPRVDEVDARLAFRSALIGGTKGSHLVLERADLAEQLGDIMLYFETPDHRACLIYRLDGGKVLLGTTDLRTAPADDAICSGEEIDYLFSALEQVLPGSALTRGDIVFSFAGIRPLPKTDGGATGAISRDHKITLLDAGPERPYPLITLIGGKWTTYRACAAQISEQILRLLKKPRLASTLDRPIGGGRGFPADAAGRAAMLSEIAACGGITPQAAERLLQRYGATALALAQGLDERGRRPIAGLEDYLAGEMLWIASRERVTRLEDIVLRRTLMAFEGAITLPALRSITALVAPCLHWDPPRRDTEIDHIVRLLSGRHHVTGLAAGNNENQQ